MARGRNEAGYRSTTSMSGCFTPSISPEATKVLVAYCEKANRNKTRVVEECIINYIPILEKERMAQLFASLSREELIEMLLERNEQ